MVTHPEKTDCLEKTLGTIKQAPIPVARRTPDSVTIQEIFDERTTAHDDLHRNRYSLRGSCCWETHTHTVGQVDM